MCIWRENQWVREKETWDGIGIELFWNHTWYAVLYGWRQTCMPLIYHYRHRRTLLHENFKSMCRSFFPFSAGCALISKSKKMLLSLLQFQLYFFIVVVIVVIIIIFFNNIEHVQFKCAHHIHVYVWCVPVLSSGIHCVYLLRPDLHIYNTCIDIDRFY